MVPGLSSHFKMRDRFDFEKILPVGTKKVKVNKIKYM